MVISESASAIRNHALDLSSGPKRETTMLFVSAGCTGVSEENDGALSDAPPRDRAPHARPSRRQLLLWGLLTTGFAAPSPALARRASSFEAIDRDRDGTIDLDEAKRAAESRFEQLDRHHTGKLSHAELGRGRLT